MRSAVVDNRLEAIVGPPLATIMKGSDLAGVPVPQGAGVNLTVVGVASRAQLGSIQNAGVSAGSQWAIEQSLQESSGTTGQGVGGFAISGGTGLMYVRIDGAVPSTGFVVMLSTRDGSALTYRVGDKIATATQVPPAMSGLTLRHSSVAARNQWEEMHVFSALSRDAETLIMRWLTNRYQVSPPPPRLIALFAVLVALTTRGQHEGRDSGCASSACRWCGRVRPAGNAGRVRAGHRLGGRALDTRCPIGCICAGCWGGWQGDPVDGTGSSHCDGHALVLDRSSVASGGSHGGVRAALFVRDRTRDAVLLWCGGEYVQLLGNVDRQRGGDTRVADTEKDARDRRYNRIARRADRSKRSGRRRRSVGGFVEDRNLVGAR